MSALAIVGASLVTPDMAPLSQERGAQSTSDPTSGLTNNGPETLKPITDGDRAGAAILTILVCVSLVGTMVWIVIGE
jgi:mannan endo-1,6-alpha-mannosidase